ncbi:MAG TPA: hypothetical protein VM076_00410 [Gemmatimonadaceae bacterium]|nr:hypothetical protein [Gemmatimonadaceae bacterium]
MFVCLWSPAWRTVADSLADLSPALLTVTPRVVTEERRGGLVWVDARGLDADHIARSALEVLRGLGLANVHVGIGKTAIVAEILAVSGIGNRESGTICRESGMGNRESMAPEVVPIPHSRFPIPDTLGSLPPSILEPNPTLAALLDGIGVETCAELAALEGEAVEVRLGADGVRLWKLARGEDDRLIFAPLPRALPHASLEWSDYALADTERLLFSVNALLGTVCEKLMDRGSLAREMTLELKLASGDTLSNGIRAGRATASRKTWLRLARAHLERLVLPAGVVGLTLFATTIVTDEGNQGDLFDRGFATAAATEAALASLAEEQGDVVVVPENTAHPLVERRTSWVGNRELGAGNRNSREAGSGKRESKKRKRGKPLVISEPNDRSPLAPPLSIVPASDSRFPIPDSRLALYLLPTPRAIETQTEERRDHVLPTAYRDGGAWYKVLSAAGPDRVSGERWGEAFAREYFRCVVDDGGMVWLYRDARADGWYIHGWWD